MKVPLKEKIKMVRHSAKHTETASDSTSGVCYGTTSMDKVTEELDKLHPHSFKTETVYDDRGTGFQLITDHARPRLLGDKEFPKSELAASLATQEIEGKLTDYQKNLLAGFREFPNSPELGEMSGAAKNSELPPDGQKLFKLLTAEVGCVPKANVHSDGSIDFNHQ